MFTITPTIADGRTMSTSHTCLRCCIVLGSVRNDRFVHVEALNSTRCTVGCDDHNAICIDDTTRHGTATDRCRSGVVLPPLIEWATGERVPLSSAATTVRRRLRWRTSHREIDRWCWTRTTMTAECRVFCLSTVIVFAGECGVTITITNLSSVLGDSLLISR